MPNDVVYKPVVECSLSFKLKKSRDEFVTRLGMKTVGQTDEITAALDGTHDKINDILADYLPAKILG